MALPELVLTLLTNGPAHGYDLKAEHDEWFPDARPLAYGQVYSTLGRLERHGLLDADDVPGEGGPERTVYSLTEAGSERLAAWLGEPVDVSGASADEIVRKTVAALRCGGDARPFLDAQRAAHLRRMRELLDRPVDEHPAARLARDHLIAHLDADLRWLAAAAERVAGVPPTQETSA